MIYRQKYGVLECLLYCRAVNEETLGVVLIIVLLNASKLTSLLHTHTHTHIQAIV